MQKILIDKRKKEDFLEQIKDLSKSYIPEWSADFEHPDIAAAISMIYASQLEENVENINQIVDRYHAEFINLLDISINPAIPAKSMVIVSLIQDTIGGTMINAGSRLLAGSEDNEEIIFETTDNIYVTRASIDNIFMSNGETAGLCSIYGDIHVPSIISDTALEEPMEDTLGQDNQGNRIKEPFRLFGENKSLGNNAIVFYHSCIFDIENNDIYVRISDSQQLIDDISAGNKYFAYASIDGLTKVEEVELLDDGITFRLRKSQENQKQLIDDKEYSLLAIVDDEPVKEDIKVAGITFSAKGDYVSADFVGNDILDGDPENFEPFGDEISLYQEFYIGHDEYFKKAGAKIKLDFDLTFKEKYTKLTKEQEESELKVIKKKPIDLPSSSPAEVYVQKVSVEYFNGIGWKRLKTDTELAEMFAQPNNKKVTVSFTCPNDWEEGTVGANDGRMIRLCVLKADDCYLRPAVHHYPIISNLRIRFSYEGKYEKPQVVKAIAGTRELNYRKELLNNEGYFAFSRMPYNEDALYIGLSEAPLSGPVSLMIKLSEGIKYEPIPCSFEYSSRDGFRPMKVFDGTMDMTRSGLLMFLPPADFSKVDLEGNAKYYIRIVRKDNVVKLPLADRLPVIEDIAINGIPVMNLESYQEQEFYLDEIKVEPTFVLPQKNIYDCQVWVNETEALSTSIMKDMLERESNRCYAEYDILGNISAFYVLWSETKRLEDSEDKRVYELDRLSSTIIFGNGIDTDIPRSLSAPAIRVRVRSSLGNLGNVEAGAINTALSNLLYIGDIYNPIKGYGGSAMETVDAALRRGANIISNRKRFVSINDYKEEVLNYSDRIDKVRVLFNQDDNGRFAEGALNLCILMKDYMDGSYSFNDVRYELKQHILDCCSITLPSSKLFVTEPIFVDISVTAWVKVERMQEAFEVQTRITEALTEYLNPVSSVGRTGWKIGALPTASQIQMKINSISGSAILMNITVVASYTDTTGYHEVSLGELSLNDAMCPRSGKHIVHVDI